MADKDTLNLIKFKFGSFQSIKDLSSKDQSSFYFASDKPTFYNAGLWYGVSSLTSSVNEDTGEVTLVLNGGFGDNWKGSQVEHTFVAGMTTQQKADLERAIGFVNSMTSTEGDTDTIINRWNEIVAFLAGFKETDVLLERITTLETGVTNLKNTTITGGDGLKGGGDLSSNRTIAMGTPSTITDSTINEAKGTTHTHAIDEASTEQRGIVRLNNSLESDSTDQALTAKQGKVLKEHIDEMFELIDKGNGVKEIKAKYGLWSDSFISARGVDEESGGVGGLDAQAVWDLLMQNDDATKVINIAHIPDITIAKITDIANASVANAVNSNKLDGKTLANFMYSRPNNFTPSEVASINTGAGYSYCNSGSGWKSNGGVMFVKNSNTGFALQGRPESLYYQGYYGDTVGEIKQLAFKATTLSGYGITDAVTLNTAQTISGEKTFTFGYGSTFSFKNLDSSLTIDVNTTGGWTHGLKWANSAVENYGYSLLGTYGSGTDILYMYMGFDGEATTSNPSFRFYKGGKLTHKTLDVQESAHANMITNLNAEMVGGLTSRNFVKQDYEIDANAYKENSVGYGHQLGGWLTSGPALNIGSVQGYSMLMQMDAWDGAIYTRRRVKGVLDESWKRLAFTDTNTLTPSGGTLTVDGNLRAEKVTSKSLISFIGNDNVERIGLQNNSSNDLLIGGGYTDKTVYLDANIFRSRANTTVLGGKVGIGTTPFGSSKLDVNGLAVLRGGINLAQNNNDSATDSAKIRFNGDLYNAVTGPSIGAVHTGSWGRKKLVFYQHNTDDFTSEYEAMNIYHNGNVGIGTTTPTAKLHVNGTALIAGNTTINGNLQVSNQLTIGNATLYWDVANQCLRVNTGIASDSFLSAKGIDTTGNGQGGGGGFDAQMMWQELTVSSTTNAGKVIDPLFLPMEEIYSPISETFNALEKRVAALEKALTWQTL